MTQEFVTLPREVVEQALKVLEYAANDVLTGRNAATALRAALEQPDHSEQSYMGCVTSDMHELAEWLNTMYEDSKEQIAALERPQVEQEPVGEAGSMPGTDGFTMACFRASDVPVGTKLYTRPHPRQPLNDDEILHTGIPEQLWFAKRFGSAPAGWTDEQIRTHNFFQSAVTQLVRAIERAHGIK